MVWLLIYYIGYWVKYDGLHLVLSTLMAVTPQVRDIARVLVVAKYIRSDYALRTWGNHQEYIHRLFEPIILYQIEG